MAGRHIGAASWLGLQVVLQLSLQARPYSKLPQQGCNTVLPFITLSASNLAVHLAWGCRQQYTDRGTDYRGPSIWCTMVS